MLRAAFVRLPSQRPLACVQVSSFTSPVLLLGVGVVDRARAVEMFGTDGAHPSEGDRGRFE